MSANIVGSNSIEHRFPWKWWLKDLGEVEKNGYKVFSTFSCGGGSTMGYKLAGFTVLGNCEIDPEMEAVYVENHHPKHTFLMDIRDFNDLGEYPEELKDLDILDGSPPCSVFSTSGKRSEGWGTEKKFREGQKMQRLDDLFFAYIRTAEILRPKIVIAENVEGLIKASARGYVNEIIKAFDEAGYVIQIFLLDAMAMGAPQRRRRVFFIGHRKDLDLPKLRMDVSEPVIKFGEVRSEKGIPFDEGTMFAKMIQKRRRGDRSFSDISQRERGKINGFDSMICADDKVAATNKSGGTNARFYDGMRYSKEDWVNTQTFPQDYNFLNLSPQYICGMSVPPVMMAQISTQVREQWLDKLP